MFLKIALFYYIYGLSFKVITDFWILPKILFGSIKKHGLVEAGLAKIEV